MSGIFGRAPREAAPLAARAPVGPAAPDVATPRSWWRLGLRLVRNAAIAVAVMTLVPVALVIRKGDRLARVIYPTNIAGKVAMIEPVRPFRLPTDPSITPMQAGIALAALQPARVAVPGFETIPPAARPVRHVADGCRRARPVSNRAPGCLRRSFQSRHSRGGRKAFQPAGDGVSPLAGHGARVERVRSRRTRARGGRHRRSAREFPSLRRRCQSSDPSLRSRGARSSRMPRSRARRITWRSVSAIPPRRCCARSCRSGSPSSTTARRDSRR